jgi:3'-5' exoribonuclease
MNINEFEANKITEGFYFVKSVEVKTTNSNNKKYMDFNLIDKTGAINAKLWDLKDIDEKIYKPNMVIKLRGTVLQWQGGLQLKIERLRPMGKDDNIDISSFVPSAPIPSEDMLKTLNSYIDKIKNKDAKKLVNYLVDQNKDKLMNYPAAKTNHHAIKGGLLYHTTTMLRAGEKLSEIYTSLNTDLLYAGVILHDLAKIEEMHANELGVVDEYTVQGQLLGHIVEGIKNIEVAADKLGTDKEVVMLLEHMVLSHHYEPEYGSPVKPMIPEAEMLHYLDIIDARLFDMDKATNNVERGTFSDRLWSLENRRVYKPNI